MERLLSDDELLQVRRLIDETQKAVICCHTNPDGDAIGSSLGWAEILRSLGKQATVIVPDQYPDFLHWLPNTERIVRYDKRKEEADTMMAEADTVFCLDFNSLQRVSDMSKALEDTKAKKVLIDHHLNPDIDCDFTISRPQASSTCELVFRLVWQLELFETTNKHFAIPIYCGMMTDTGAFSFNSNDPDIFFIISQLLTKNINKDKIYRNVYHTYSEDRLRLMGYVLYEKLVVYSDLHASFYALRREDLVHFHFVKGDAEGLVNLPLQIKGMKLSVSLREDTVKEGVVWVSLRSVDSFPCNEMAERFFNGGGHLNAAGGKLFGSMDEAIERTKMAIEAYREKLEDPQR